MDYKKGIDRLLERYGRDATIENLGKRYSDKAIIQLMRYKNKIYVDLPIGPSGMRDNATYLYIGKPEHDFSTSWRNVRIFADGLHFLVKRAQMIYCGQEPLYLWAVLYPAIRDGAYEGF
ncbi:MAG: hypothetical protein IKL62_02930 [Clostridia bacterium]|nr:hypothetical protein [Clostridia bacterium]